MKKRILIGAMTCWIALSAQAQFQYERALPMPTRDPYDTGVMNLHMRALAETSARRQQRYEDYSELAFSAFNNRQWNSVISYVDQPLNTMFYCGELFYICGYGYEQLGN